jgi:hypothetical protein
MRALALFLLTAAVACAQFKSTAALVIAPVTDSKGKYIDALDPADLVLYDNGVREP